MDFESRFEIKYNFKDFDEISVRRKIEREKGSKYFIYLKNFCK